MKESELLAKIEMQQRAAEQIRTLQESERALRAEILDEIAQVNADPKQKRDVLLNMITVCDSDGTIDGDEKKELAAVANVLGLRLEDWL